MKEEEALKIFQYYRHDIMNHLQIISGYLSIGKTEKVAEKIYDLMDQFSRERQLMATKASQFILWLLTINHVETNIRVHYDLQQDDINLMPIDEKIMNHCKLMIAAIKTIGRHDELYQVEILIRKNCPQMNQVKVVFHINGQINHDALFAYIEREQSDPPIHLEHNDNGINGTMIYYLS